MIIPRSIQKCSSDWPLFCLKFMINQDHSLALIGTNFPSTIWKWWVIVWIVRACNVSIHWIFNDQGLIASTWVYGNITGVCILNYRKMKRVKAIFSIYAKAIYNSESLCMTLKNYLARIQSKIQENYFVRQRRIEGTCLGLLKHMSEVYHFLLLLIFQQDIHQNLGSLESSYQDHHVYKVYPD